MTERGVVEKTSGLGERSRSLERLGNERFDLLVVGGGITGAGIAALAANSGYHCALVEADDFAAGTSSRSSKMIHGGLRYLARREFGMARQSLAERNTLLRIAPDLVWPLPFLIPLTKPFEPLLSAVALSLYEALAGRGSLPTHEVIGRDRARSLVPELERPDLRGAVRYFDAQTDDHRLVIGVLKQAVSAGAVIANHARAAGFDQLSDGIAVSVFDDRLHRMLTVRARTAIAAVGAALPQLAAFSPSARTIRPAKGTHVVLRTASPYTSTVVLRHPEDGRYVFLVPWRGRLILGTTDTPCDQTEVEDPCADQADLDYLFVALRTWLPHLPFTIDAAWAGVRPLVDPAAPSTADASREDRILQLSGTLFAVAGGKLTTYRAIAAKMLDVVSRSLGPPTRTGVMTRSAIAGPTDGVSGHLRDTDRLLDDDVLLSRLMRSCAEHEMVETLDDLVSQRLGLSLLAPAVANERADSWAKLVGELVGWSEAQQHAQARDLRSRLYRFQPPKQRERLLQARPPLNLS